MQMDARLFWLPLFLLTGCSTVQRFDDGAGHAQPLAAWLVQGFAGQYGFSCDDAKTVNLLIAADGSSRLNNQPLIDTDHPGGLILEGNGGSPAHVEPDRIVYSVAGNAQALQVPDYPATVSLTLQKQAGAGGALVLSLVSSLDGSHTQLTISDFRQVRSCKLVNGRVALARVQPEWLIARLVQQQTVSCHTGIAREIESGVFSISAGGQVSFPDGQHWPITLNSGKDWNFQLQDDGSFSGGHYRLLLDSDNTPRSLLGREVTFDQLGRVMQLHYLGAGGESVECRPG